jgi:hypothetical protein
MRNTAGKLITNVHRTIQQDLQFNYLFRKIIAGVTIRTLDLNNKKSYFVLFDNCIVICIWFNVITSFQLGKMTEIRQYQFYIFLKNKSTSNIQTHSALVKSQL